MNYPKTIVDLISCFKKLPSIGEKSAERLALAILELDDETLNLFSASIKNVKANVKKCKICHHLAEGDICEICKNKQTREKNTICVVEDPKNVIVFEKIGTYNGLYHVLDGLISPLDGINPEDINLFSLIDRIKKEEIKEIIIALKPSVEGETTSLYISKMLSDMDVKITKIAHGIPLGVEMEYLDSLTLEMALEDRKEIS